MSVCVRCPPDCASLKGVHSAPVTTGCLSAFPPLACRLCCFLQEGGEVGGDWWGDTTGEVESGWGRRERKGRATTDYGQ